MAYTRYEASQTLPEKFSRMLEKNGLGDKVNGKTVAIKMHVGSGITYSTIPPVFVRKLVDFVHTHGGDCFITDHYVYKRHPEQRGYTESNLDVPCWTTAAIWASISTRKKWISKPSGTWTSPDSSTTRIS